MDVDIQLNCPLGETTEEIPYKPAAQHAYLQVEWRAATEEHPVDLRFGKTEPLFEDTGQTVTFRDLKKMKTCLAIVALLLLIFSGSIHLASKTQSSDFTGTSDKTYSNLLIPEEDKCDCSGATPAVNIDNEILVLMAYDAPNVQDMFKEPVITNDIDKQTCALYDIFQHLFKKLCSLKDDIIGTSPKDSQSGTVSPMNADISKETSAINPRDELVVEDSE